MKRVRFKPRAEHAYAVDPKAFNVLFMPCGDLETELVGNVAVVKIDGPLEHKKGWFFDSYEAILARFNEAIDDDAARAIVLKIDSPGGDVDGLMETCKAMRLAKEASGKPVYAYANELAASAAYALATVADEIHIPSTGGVGSIGVVSMLCEQTKRDAKDGFHFEVVVSGARKPDGNPHIEISDGARARVNKRVQSLAQIFFELVSKSRGISVDDIKGLEADVFFGADAVSKKLADGVMSFSEMLDAAQVDESLPMLIKGKVTMSMLALRKAKKDAEAKLAAAKTAAARKKAQAVYTKAVEALAKAEADAQAAKTVKKYKRMEEEKTEETSDDAEGAEDADDAADDGDAEDAADDAADDADDDADDADDADDGDDDSDDDDDAEDAEDAEDGKKAAAASLKQVVFEITGKSDPREAIGALKGMAMAHKQFSTLAKEVASLKNQQRRDRVKVLVEKAISSGRLMPSQREAFTKIGMRDTRELKGLLETMPKRVRMEDEGELRDSAQGAGGAELTEREREIAQRSGAMTDDGKLLYEKAKKEGKLVALDRFVGIEN